MLDQPATTGAASAMAIDRRLLKRVFGWLAIDGHLPPSRWGIGLQRVMPSAHANPAHS
jgi:hypothetical protein